MASRREKLDKSDPFAKRRGALPNSGPSLADLTNSMLAPLEEASTTEPEKIDIFSIVPDPGQPRRAIPAGIRGDWIFDPSEIKDVLEYWRTQANIDIAYYLSGRFDEDEEHDRPTLTNPYAIALMDVVDLAMSIQRDGMVNPITVIKDGMEYRIETGERRWLAHHILFVYTGSDQYRSIMARVLENLNVWRQASENNARSNLNAISKARQFSILLMDIYRQRGQTFINYDEAIQATRSDQAYYAQVADEKLYRIPRGTAEILLNAMGFKNKSSLKRHRDLLGLPEDIWKMADDYDMPESVLRRLIGLPHSQMLMVVNQWLDQRKVANGNLSPDEKAKEDDKNANRATRFEMFQNRLIPKIDDTIRKLKGVEREQAIRELEELLETLKQSD